MNNYLITDIESLTLEYGEIWGLAHAHRLLKLIEAIGAGLEYDRQTLAWAVYLHDWGAYPKYARPGVEHALRSKQVAEAEILPFAADLSPEAKETILEAIDLHDYRDTRPVRSNEALLLREADYLDFLGAVGIARGFASAAKDLLKSIKVIQTRKECVHDRFTIPAAQAIATQRLKRMEAFMQALEEESFGYL